MRMLDARYSILDTRYWMPAFAGMTGNKNIRHSRESGNPGTSPRLIEKLPIYVLFCKYLNP